MLRYPCLVLDHDDTTVDSTRAVNYPQFCEALARFRPHMEISEAQFFRYCFDPGFYAMCEQILGYTPEEMEAHVAMWKAYHQTHHPQFFPGIPEILRRQRAEGGRYCVVSHSEADVILAAYDRAGVPRPDLVLGAEQPPERRKPAPWPLQEIMRRFSLEVKDLLMVDDMPHGGVMARAVGVDFACAGWYGMLPDIEENMRRQCDFFFSTVEAFARFLFGDENAIAE